MDCWRRCLAIALCLCLASVGVATAQAAPKVPDYTAGDTPPADGPHDWTLGPTGARGYFFVHRNATAYARQCYISKVDPGSPADGILQPGDVIIGITNREFDDDARITLARAIQQAQAQRGGKLRLLRFRDGQKRMVTIELETLPDFSPTAPYDCEKSAKLLEAGAKALAAKGLGRPGLPEYINAMALLATADPAYLPMVREFAHAVATRDLSNFRGYKSWEYSYATLFLAEYYLATKDPVVFDRVRANAIEIAQGQSQLGNWGHRFVDNDLGRLNGYGSINSPSVPLALAMVLARECGVDEPVVDAAIDRSADFYRRFVGLGAIPYGDHPANRQYGHDDNGKNSNAAVFYDLLGDAEATDYYRMTALAAINADREQGHTGNFFNILWSMPGVQRGGPLATGGYLAEFGWYYDLARDWKHGYPYQGNPDSKRDAYARWDCPGVYLLHLALPKKALRITGKGPATLEPMDAQQVKTALDAGLHNYPQMSPAELTNALSSWSPIVRYEAAKELKSRGVEPTQDLAPLARSDRQDQQVAGLVGVTALAKPNEVSSADPLFDAAVLLLQNGSPQVQHEAVRALVSVNRERAVAVMMPYLAAYEPGQDPTLSRLIVNELFPGNARDTFRPLNLIEDRELALKVARQMLQHEDARLIGQFAGALSHLPQPELAELMPDIITTGANNTRGNIMFMMGARTGCLAIATQHRIQEAIAPLVELALYQGWGRDGAVRPALQQLATYGSAAAEYLPQLRAAREAEKDEKFIAMFDRAIEKISADNNPPRTLTIQDFQREAGQNVN